MEWINTITELKLVSNSCNKKLFYLFQVQVEISSSAKKFNFNKIKVICGIAIFLHRVENKYPAPPDIFTPQFISRNK